MGDRPSGGAVLSCWANSRYGSAAGAGRWAGSGILARAGLFRRIAERLAGQCTSPAHPSDGGFGVVAKLLCDPSGTALAAEFTDGRGDGMLHLSSAGIIRALQGRHEEGVGLQGANTRMLHRSPRDEPPPRVCARKAGRLVSVLHVDEPAVEAAFIQWSGLQFPESGSSASAWG